MLKNLLGQILHRRRQRSPIDDFSEVPFYDDADLGRWIAEKAQALKREYMDFPALVHIETLAQCNAACVSCPYSKMERKGTQMPDALIEKIIEDLTDIPPSLRFQLSPYKISDPFLDSRLFDILARVNERLPNAAISLITNGAALTERNLDLLARVRNVAYLTVSLNFHDPLQYEESMNMPFARTLSRLEGLQKKHAQGAFDFPVRISRISVSKDEDREFLAWARTKYPQFNLIVLPRNDWLGAVESSDTASRGVPDVPCHRWFDFSITATGTVAMCCMDGNAQFPKGDVRERHVLEIYNQAFLRQLRESLPSRRGLGAPCSRCTYLSY
ncbi:MAG: radical SAM protein [Rhodospirillales bacterium]|nr:radical SAM protein [Rhodospirillales bacterium]